MHGFSKFGVTLGIQPRGSHDICFSAMALAHTPKSVLVQTAFKSDDLFRCVTRLQLHLSIESIRDTQFSP